MNTPFSAQWLPLATGKDISFKVWAVCPSGQFPPMLKHAWMCLWSRFESPCWHPEAGGDPSGSAADEGGEAGGRKTAPHAFPPEWLLTAQVRPKRNNNKKSGIKLEWLTVLLLVETCQLSYDGTKTMMSALLMWVTTYKTRNAEINKREEELIFKRNQ